MASSSNRWFIVGMSAVLQLCLRSVRFTFGAISMTCEAAAKIRLTSKPNEAINQT